GVACMWCVRCLVASPYRSKPPPRRHRSLRRPFLTASGSLESRAAARPARPPRQERIPLGILYMIVATALFAGSSAISKLLVVTYPIGEILFTRCAVGLACVAAFILPRKGLAVFETGKLGAHTLRSVSQMFSQTFILLAFSMMPLASAVAINFSAAIRHAGRRPLVQRAGHPGALDRARGRLPR